MRYNFKPMTSTAKIPDRHTAVAAGVDFYSDTDVVIPPRQSRIVSTGVSWNPSIPLFFRIFRLRVSIIIQSRSGYSFKKDIECGNAGVIDQDYNPHGDEPAIIHVKLYNHGSERFHVKKGDKIAQGVPQLIPFFEDIESLDESRQGRGFGSSDEK